MKVETPQILWNGEGDKNVNAALLSVALLDVVVVAAKTTPAASPPRPLPRCNSSTADVATPIAPAQASAAAAAAATSVSSILATAGNSSVVNLWNNLTFQCSLSRLDGACNSVRFSPNGLHLAGAGEHALVVWSIPPGRDKSYWTTVTREQDLNFHVAARHGEAFMDLCWSTDSTRLVAGSIDHSVIVCELQGTTTTTLSTATTTTASSVAAAAAVATRHPLGDVPPSVTNVSVPATAPTQVSTTTVPQQYQWKTIYRHDDHSHFVQGVAFDPLQFYVASMSSDRTIRLHARKVPKKWLSTAGVAGATTATTGPTASSSSAACATTVAAIPPPPPGVDVNALDFTKSKLIKYRTTSVGSNHNHSTTTVDEQLPPTTLSRHLFHDEATLESFVRRLAFTNDGAFLIAPAAQWHLSSTSSSSSDEVVVGETPAAHATLLFARHKWDEPCRVLVGLQKVRRHTASIISLVPLGWLSSHWCDCVLFVCLFLFFLRCYIQPSIAIRPCPVYFHLPDEMKENSCHGLPYRSVFAVLTWDSVVLYDTVHTHPLGIVTGLHYCNLVDAAWSSDGRTLLVCSTDGYISILRFEEGELGQVHPGPATATMAASTMELTPPTTTATATASSLSASVVVPPTKGPHPVPHLPQPAAPTLPPCEPGVAVVEGRPPKRAKLTPLVVVVASSDDEPRRTATTTTTTTDTTAALLVHNMTLHDPTSSSSATTAKLPTTTTTTKPKKRVQLISLAST